MNHFKQLLLIILLPLIFINSLAQTIPSSRSVDWTIAGLHDTSTVGFNVIDMQNEGLVGDGITPNDSLLEAVLSSLQAPGSILVFPVGNFLFNNTIELSSNTIIKGQGASQTTFTMNLNGSGHSIAIQGQTNFSYDNLLSQSAYKDSSFIYVTDTAGIYTGDWIQILLNDSDLVTSSWAYNTVGQIARISDIINNKVILDSPLRMDFDINKVPHLRKLQVVNNTGIECLKIFRQDYTAPQQSSNIYFMCAANCWVKAVESENCTFSHIEARRSSNIYISYSYFHHAFDYGSGGRGYGVMLHSTTGECLVENNIFQHLRHSMIVQSGANGNVFSYNYSFDPYWSSFPNNSSGDMVLHGNYPSNNLFEGNICQNIVIDNSHGPNGPNNTFFRNRAESYGIFFSASNSPGQNLIGNEIPNTSFPYSIVNYTILGDNHFLYGNNNKGTIDPTGTETLPDSSYAYQTKPGFIPLSQWAGIGTPNVMTSSNIPAYDRYISNDYFGNACEGTIVGIQSLVIRNTDIDVFPNPVNSKFSIKSDYMMNGFSILNIEGQILLNSNNPAYSYIIDSCKWPQGIYFIKINLPDSKIIVKAIIKTD